MAKEKFVRSKPHVNFFDGLKQKLFGAPPPEEPPIEPLDGADAEGGSMLLPRVGWEVLPSATEGGPPDNPAAESAAGLLIALEPQHHGAGFDPEQAQGPDALQDTDGDDVPEVEDGWAEAAMFNPKELTVDKTVPGGGANELTLDDSPGSAAGPVPVPYPNLAEGDATEPAAGVGPAGIPTPFPIFSETSKVGVDQPVGEDAPKYDHVFQHNQTDLDFPAQPAAGAGDPDQPLIVGRLSNTAGESDFIPQHEDQVLVGFEPGESGSPIIVGQLWNSQETGDEGPSVMVDLTPSQKLVPFEANAESNLDLDSPDMDDDDHDLED